MASSLKRKPRNSLRFDLASASPRPVVAVVPIILGEMEATATGVTGRTLREERERGEKEGGREGGRRNYHFTSLPLALALASQRIRGGGGGGVALRPIGEVWRIIHNCPETATSLWKRRGGKRREGRDGLR